MNSVEDTKWVVAKAIRDNIIEGRLDYKTNTMISNETHDVYRTKEPAVEFQKINLAYSRMKLETVRDRLGMNSVEDTKWVVAKAIRDNIIEARLDYKTNTMISNETHDVYRTKEP